MGIRPNVYSFDFAGGTAILKQPEVQPGGEARYFIDDSTVSKSFGQVLRPLIADWIDVALAIYTADRLALWRRKSSDYHRYQWSRIIQVRIPVREIEAWARPSVYDSLLSLLYFLTEDRWEIEFVPYNGSRRSSETQEFLFEREIASGPVALYSGELDSFAGAIHNLWNPDRRTTCILISGSSGVRQRAAQRAQVAALQKVFRRPILHLAVPYELQGNGPSTPQEKSQRSRGFLFLSLGGAVAAAAGTNELHVYENGIGALNLPYDGTQLGTYNSRAVHPIALIRMKRFASALLGEPFPIHNPFLFRTKADTCRHPGVRSVAEQIKSTFSCDGFPMRVKYKTQCGSCTSCLLRRQALESAGLSEFDPREGYLRDLFSPGYVGPARDLRPLSAMEWQVKRIEEAVSGSDPWHQLVLQFPELQTAVTEICVQSGSDLADLQGRFLRLYSQYASEWVGFSARQSLRPAVQAA